MSDSGAAVDAIELVNYNGDFASSSEELKAWFKKRTAAASQSPFNVVAVLGCQSSGKSTLLNRLFGTKYPELNAAEGRQQTTKGIWIDVDSERPLFVMDVEGTDSKERGEDRLTFEHRASLFCLAMADVLICNMWFNDIGRYTTSAYALLKTVIEVNLEMQVESTPTFPSDRQSLLFCIRDWSPKLTPIEKLKNLIVADVEVIWNEIKKPDGMDSALNFDSFFRCEVVGLPNKFQEVLSGVSLAPGQDSAFEGAVKDLRRDLVSKILPSEYSRAVPLDGMHIYAKGVWETILGKRELNIPSQCAMVAMHRCEEVIAEIMVSLETQESGDSQTSSRIVESFKSAKDILDWLHKEFAKNSLEKFDQETAKYDRQIVGRKRTELCAELGGFLQRRYVNDWILFMGDNVVDEARGKIAETKNKFVKDRVPVDVAPTEALNCTGLLLSSATDKFTNEVEKKLMSASLDAFGSAVFDVDIHKQKVVKEVLLLIADFLETTSQQFVQALANGAVYKTVLPRMKKVLSTETLSALLETFPSTLEETIKDAVKSCATPQREVVWKDLLEGRSRFDSSTQLVASDLTHPLSERVKEETEEGLGEMGGAPDELSRLLVARFESRFSFEPDTGVPVVWGKNSPEEIKERFTQGKEFAFAVLDLWSTFRNEWPFKGMSSAATKTLLDKSAEIAEEGMVKSCRTAQEIQEGKANRAMYVPWYFWVVLVILGQNEIRTVLSSPLYTLAVLLVVITGFVLHLTGTWGLAVAILRSASAGGASAVLPTVQIVLAHLQECIGAPQAPHASAHKDDVKHSPQPSQLREKKHNE